MKKLVFSIILLIQVFFSYSQEDSLSALHNVFAPLNRNKIPYGILSDYGVQFVSFAPFNGTLTDSSYTSLDVWQMLYAGLNSSVINSNISFEGFNTVSARLNAAFKADSNTVFVPIINYGYSSLNPDAAILGLIGIQNEHLFDIPNKNPYLTKTLFATAPSRSYAMGSSVTFCLRSDMYLSNLSATVARVDAEFGNGSGYQQVTFGVPFTASYSASGEVTVRVKVTLTDATVLYSHFKMYIEVPPATKVTYPSVTIKARTGVHLGGTISWQLSSRNSTGKIRQPLIVVEGFDPLAILLNDNFTLDKFIKTINWFSPINSTRTFIGELDYSEYDIVFLDYNNGIDDIFHNAKLLEQVIDSVNRWKAGVPNAQPNVVMGVSMGGLVAKIALRSMELAGKSHDTRLFISMDSPHKGANVPVGFQAMLRHLADLKIYITVPIPIEVVDVSEKIEIIGSAVKVLNSKAAKQMLKYRVTLNGNSLVYDNTEHEAFQQQYDAISFPTQCRNVAVSNGSISGTRIFEPGATILDLYQRHHLNFWGAYFGGMVSWLSIFTNYPQFADIPLITYNSDIIAEFNVKGVPNQQSSKVYDGRFAVKKRILYIITKEINLTHRTLHATTSMLPYDGASGGINSLDISTAEGLSSEYRKLIKGALKQENFSFIPAASSLAVNSIYPNARLDNQNLISNGETPFVSYFAQHENEVHTLFTPSNARYILNELSGIYNPTPFGSVVRGPSSSVKPGEYTTNYFNTNATYSWTKSSNLSIVEGQGTTKARFEKISPGASWVELAINTSSGNVSIKNTIRVGVVKPSIVGPQNIPNNMVIAPCIGEQNYFKVYPEALDITEYKWWLYGGNYPEMISTTTKAYFTINNESEYTITSEQYDYECGWSGTTYYSFIGRDCSNSGGMYSVYPNPSTSNVITVAELITNKSDSTTQRNGTTNTKKIVSLFNWDGTLVMQKNFNPSEKECPINVSTLKNGRYIIQIWEDNKLIQTEHIVLQR